MMTFLSQKALENAYTYARKACSLTAICRKVTRNSDTSLPSWASNEFSLTEFRARLSIESQFHRSRLACALIFAGEFEKGDQNRSGAHACRSILFPHSFGVSGMAFYMLKQYDNALHLLRECVSRAPKLRDGHVWLAATHARMGQVKQPFKKVIRIPCVLKQNAFGRARR